MTKKRKMSLHVEDVFFDNPFSESKKDWTIKQKNVHYTTQKQLENRFSKWKRAKYTIINTILLQHWTADFTNKL